MSWLQITATNPYTATEKILAISVSSGQKVRFLSTAPLHPRQEPRALLLIKRNVGALTGKEDAPTDWLGFEAQREALRQDCHAQSRRSGAPRLAVKLGGRKVAEPARPPQKAITADAQARSERPSSHPRDQRADARSLRTIAAALNAPGVATVRGGRWQAQTVLVANVLRQPLARTVIALFVLSERNHPQCTSVYTPVYSGRFKKCRS